MRTSSWPRAGSGTVLSLITSEGSPCAASCNCRIRSPFEWLDLWGSRHRRDAVFLLQVSVGCCHFICTFVFGLYCVSIGIQITLDKTVSSDLFTYRYEIRDCGDTARATPRL